MNQTHLSSAAIYDIPKPDYPYAFYDRDGNPKHGKVRDAFIPDNPDLLVQVASDRLSGYDVKFSEGIPFKGALLVLPTSYWKCKLDHIVPNDLLKTMLSDSDFADYAGLEKNREIYKYRTQIVCRYRMLPQECIVRDTITGSVLASRAYDPKTGMLFGQFVGKDLLEFQPLEQPVFTPSTKADIGHDVNYVRPDAAESDIMAFAESLGLTRQDGSEIFSEMKYLSLKLFDFGKRELKKHNLAMLDTKLEFGIYLHRAKDGRHLWQLVLADEVFTPDSSRIISLDEQKRVLEAKMKAGGGIYDKATTIKPASFDKQPIRDKMAEWDRTGFWKIDSGTPPPPLDEKTKWETTNRYLSYSEFLFGKENSEQGKVIRQMREFYNQREK